MILVRPIGFARFRECLPKEPVLRPSSRGLPGPSDLFGSDAAEVVFVDIEPLRAVSRASEAAARATRLEIPGNRIVVCPMEPRSAIVEYEPANGR